MTNQKVEEITELKIQKSNPLKRYEIISIIGKGASGKVYKVKRICNDIIIISGCRSDSFGPYFAAKVINTKIYPYKKIEDEVRISFGQCKRRQNEALILFESYWFNDEFWIINEYCPSGSFRDIIDNYGTFTELEVWAIIWKVLWHFFCKFHRGFIHRDIKSTNVFLTTPIISVFSIKVGDYGISIPKDYKKKENEGFNGTIRWCAPEMFDENKEITEKVDIWAFGLLIHELLEGFAPYHDKSDDNEVIRSIIEDPPPKLKYPNRWSHHMKEFLSYCLQKDVEKRLSAKQLHNFVKKIFPSGEKRSAIVFQGMLSIFEKVKVDKNANINNWNYITADSRYLKIFHSIAKDLNIPYDIEIFQSLKKKNQNRKNDCIFGYPLDWKKNHIKSQNNEFHFSRIRKKNENIIISTIQNHVENKNEDVVIHDSIKENTKMFSSSIESIKLNKK